MKRVRAFSGLFLMMLGMLLSGGSSAQVLSLRPGNILIYSVSENGSKEEYSFALNTLHPSWNVVWQKKESHESCSFQINEVACKSAINILFHLESNTRLIDMRDQLLGIRISSSVFSDLKSNKPALIRTDCNLSVENLVLKGKKKMTLTVSQNAMEVDVLLLTFGTFNDELWVIDNPDFPLIVKMKGQNSWELLEIK